MFRPPGLPTVKADVTAASSGFGEVLMPMLQEVGVSDPPEVYAAHTFVSA